MITLHSYEVSADIKDRYAICRYHFEFENTHNSGSKELRFEITIDPNAFISKFTANIDGVLFISETKEKQTASKEYSTAKAKDENAILISQPYKNIPNVFEIKTNVDANSKISLMIQIEEYLQKTFGFNALSIQILRNFSKYNIEQRFNSIRFKLNVEDISGIYDVKVPITNNDIVIDAQQMDKLNKKCQISGIITNKSTSSDADQDEKWRQKLKVNDAIDVKDGGKWYTSKVLEVNKDTNTIKIHYLGYSNQEDEDININSERLAPENINCSTKINELTLKYKIKGEQSDSHLLFDYKSHTFCHIISDIISDSTISDASNTNEGQNDHNMNNISIPRRVIFVVDKSGSMGGKKWLNTISATTKALQQLRNGYDRFAVIFFNTDINILLQDSCCMYAEDKNMSQILDMIKNENVGGGTNINDALLTAIELIKKDITLLNNDKECKHNFFMNQILFLTDGQPNGGETDTKQIISNVQNANDLSAIDKYNKKISLFTFGVGNDANDSRWTHDLNHAFLKLLAINNHGFYQRIKESYADTKLAECFNILSKPILSNIKVQYQNKNISDLTNTTFNTLYSGNDLIICGKVEKKHTMDYLTMNLSISAISGTITKHNKQSITKPINIRKRMKVNIDSTANNNNTNNTERIWAYLKLQQYARRQLTHENDIIEMDDDEKEEQHAVPLALALQYKFVTPWSSMIVVKKKDIEQHTDQEAVELTNPQINDESHTYMMSAAKPLGRSIRMPIGYCGMMPISANPPRSSSSIRRTSTRTQRKRSFLCAAPKLGGGMKPRAKNWPMQQQNSMRGGMNNMAPPNPMMGGGIPNSYMYQQQAHQTKQSPPPPPPQSKQSGPQSASLYAPNQSYASSNQPTNYGMPSFNSATNIQQQMANATGSFYGQQQQYTPQYGSGMPQMQNNMYQQSQMAPNMMPMNQMQQLSGSSPYFGFAPQQQHTPHNYGSGMSQMAAKPPKKRKHKRKKKKNKKSLPQMIPEPELNFALSDNFNVLTSTLKINSQHSVSQLSGGASAPTSAPMLEVNPLTAEMLKDAKPAEKKRLIGERLFPKIQVIEPRLAGKITSMLLEMDNIQLLVLLGDQRALMAKIGEAIGVLKDKQDRQSKEKWSLKDHLNDLQRNPIGNCSVKVSDDMKLWNVSIGGNSDSAYAYGSFDVEIRITNGFPIKPPHVLFVTKIYHCNIEDGNINLDILQEDKWSAGWSIRDILYAIIKLLYNPNLKDALVTDIAALYVSDRNKHDAIAKDWTQKFAQ